MIFLIEYDRARGKIVQLRSFEDVDRPVAENARIDREVAMNRQGLDHEVVLFEANSERALRRTHRRYFESLGEIGRSQPR